MSEVSRLLDVQGKDCLDAHVKCRNVEGFEENLGGSISIAPRVEWGFGEENGVLGKPSISWRVQRDSYRRTSSLSVPSSSWYTQFHIFSISSQLVTTPCSMG